MFSTIRIERNTRAVTNSKYLYLRIDLLKSIHHDIVAIATPSAAISGNWMQLAVNAAEKPNSDWAVAFFLCQAAEVLRDCDHQTLRDLADEIDLAREEFCPEEQLASESAEQHARS